MLKPGQGMTRVLALGALFVSIGLVAGCGNAAKKSATLGKPPAEIYQEAEASMAAKKYAKAIRRYTRIDTVREPDLRAQVHLRLADAYFAQKYALALVEAQARYQSFLNFFPLSDQAPYAQYRLALCLKRQINPPERDQASTHRAIAEFRKVEELYPNSSWVIESRARVSELEDHLTRDSFLKARFYHGRRRYTSAIDRLNDILDANPDYDRIDEVLYYLGMSLTKLGLPVDGEVVLQRILDEHADSKFAGKARKALRRIRSSS